MAIPPMPTLVSPSGVSDPRALIEWGKEGWEERERCLEAWRQSDLDAQMYRDALSRIAVAVADEYGTLNPDAVGFTGELARALMMLEPKNGTR